MIEAIEGAEKSIGLMSYIFDNDAWGKRFVEALGRAHERGVEVRVLVDAAGARYSFPSIFKALRKVGVRGAKFLPTSLRPLHLTSINLRNHRKILVVDGTIGFTGGINIRQACVIDDCHKFPTHDLHFRLRGPVVAHLRAVLVEDWTFSTKEGLDVSTWGAFARSRGGRARLGARRARGARRGLREASLDAPRRDQRRARLDHDRDPLLRA